MSVDVRGGRHDLGRFVAATWEPREPGPRAWCVLDRRAGAVVRESVSAPWRGAYVLAALAASRLDRGVVAPAPIVAVLS